MRLPFSPEIALRSISPPYLVSRFFISLRSLSKSPVSIFSVALRSRLAMLVLPESPSTSSMPPEDVAPKASLLE